MSKNKKNNTQSQGTSSITLDENDYRLHALNADGILFQERVRALLEDAGLSFHASEYGVDTGKPRVGGIHRESKLDLWFRLKQPGCIFEILVECKKADPKLKEWIFLSKHNSQNIYKAENVVRDNKSIWRRNILNVGYIGFFAFAGRELKGEWKKTKGESWKTSSERIEKACDQISIACNSIALRLQDSKDHQPTSGGMPHFVVPVIVTSASLKGCDIGKNFLQSSDSEISKAEVNFSSLNALVIQHALSSHLQRDLLVYQDELSQQYVQASGYIEVLICSPESAGSEIIGLCKSIAKVYDPNTK